MRDKPGQTTRAGAPILDPRKPSAPLVAELSIIIALVLVAGGFCALHNAAMVKDRFTPTR